MKLWGYLGIGFLVLAGAGILGVEYLGRTRVDPIIREYSAIQKSHLEAFIEDQTFLRRSDFFVIPPADSADAGKVLNLRLPWQPPPKDENPKPARLSKELTERILRYRGDWMRHHGPLLKGNPPDLSLFDKIETFQIWDIEKTGPIAKLMDTGIFVVPEALPIPDSIEIITLAKLRLAAGAEYKNPKVALSQVRKLARLLLTTENIHLFSTGLSLLDIERVALTYYTDSGLLGEGEWQPVSRNYTRRASRAVWAARGYLHAWTDPEIIEKVFLGPDLPVGFCAAINEGAPKELSLRSIFMSQFPFERDLRGKFRLLEKVVARAKANCRIRYLSRMEELNRLRSVLPVPAFLTVLPFSRKIFGLRLATLPFTGFEAYKENVNR